MIRSSLSMFVASALGVSSVASASVVSGVYLGYGSHEQWGCAYKSSLSWDATSSVNHSNLKLSERLWDIGDGRVSVTWCAQVYQGVTIGSSYTFDVVSMDWCPRRRPLRARWVTRRLR